ncbi:MAG: hypothetical protein ACTSU5_12195 [Promethearchaeota archaeon]
MDRLIEDPSFDFVSEFRDLAPVLEDDVAVLGNSGLPQIFVDILSTDEVQSRVDVLKIIQEIVVHGGAYLFKWTDLLEKLYRFIQAPELRPVVIDLLKEIIKSGQNIFQGYNFENLILKLIFEAQNTGDLVDYIQFFAELARHRARVIEELGHVEKIQPYLDHEEDGVVVAAVNFFYSIGSYDVKIINPLFEKFEQLFQTRKREVKIAVLTILSLYFEKNPKTINKDTLQLLLKNARTDDYSFLVEHLKPVIYFILDSVIDLEIDFVDDEVYRNVLDIFAEKRVLQKSFGMETFSFFRYHFFDFLLEDPETLERLLETFVVETMPLENNLPESIPAEKIYFSMKQQLVPIIQEIPFEKPEFISQSSAEQKIIATYSIPEPKFWPLATKLLSDLAKNPEVHFFSPNTIEELTTLVQKQGKSLEYHQALRDLFQELLKSRTKTFQENPQLFEKLVLYLGKLDENALKSAIFILREAEAHNIPFSTAPVVAKVVTILDTGLKDVYEWVQAYLVTLSVERPEIVFEGKVLSNLYKHFLGENVDAIEVAGKIYSTLLSEHFEMFDDDHLETIYNSYQELADTRVRHHFIEMMDIVRQKDADWFSGKHIVLVSLKILEEFHGEVGKELVAFLLKLIRNKWEYAEEDEGFVRLIKELDSDDADYRALVFKFHQLFMKLKKHDRYLDELPSLLELLTPESNSYDVVRKANQLLEKIPPGLKKYHKKFEEFVEEKFTQNRIQLLFITLDEVVAKQTKFSDEEVAPDAVGLVVLNFIRGLVEVHPPIWFQKNLIPNLVSALQIQHESVRDLTFAILALLLAHDPAAFFREENIPPVKGILFSESDEMVLRSIGLVKEEVIANPGLVRGHAFCVLLAKLMYRDDLEVRQAAFKFLDKLVENQEFLEEKDEEGRTTPYTIASLFTFRSYSNKEYPYQLLNKIVTQKPANILIQDSIVTLVRNVKEFDSTQVKYLCSLLESIATRELEILRHMDAFLKLVQQFPELDEDFQRRLFPIFTQTFNQDDSILDGSGIVASVLGLFKEAPADLKQMGNDLLLLVETRGKYNLFEEGRATDILFDLLKDGVQLTFLKPLARGLIENQPSSLKTPHLVALFNYLETDDDTLVPIADEILLLFLEKRPDLFQDPGAFELFSRIFDSPNDYVRNNGYYLASHIIKAGVATFIKDPTLVLKTLPHFEDQGDSFDYIFSIYEGFVELNVGAIWSDQFKEKLYHFYLSSEDVAHERAGKVYTLIIERQPAFLRSKGFETWIVNQFNREREGVLRHRDLVLIGQLFKCNAYDLDFLATNLVKNVDDQYEANVGLICDLLKDIHDENPGLFQTEDYIPDLVENLHSFFDEATLENVLALIEAVFEKNPLIFDREKVYLAVVKLLDEGYPRHREIGVRLLAKYRAHELSISKFSDWQAKVFNLLNDQSSKVQYRAAELISRAISESPKEVQWKYISRNVLRAYSLLGDQEDETVKLAIVNFGLIFKSILLNSSGGGKGGGIPNSSPRQVLDRVIDMCRSVNFDIARYGLSILSEVCSTSAADLLDPRDFETLLLAFPDAEEFQREFLKLFELFFYTNPDKVSGKFFDALVRNLVKNPNKFAPVVNLAYEVVILRENLDHFPNANFTKFDKSIHGAINNKKVDVPVEVREEARKFEETFP